MDKLNRNSKKIFNHVFNNQFKENELDISKLNKKKNEKEVEILPEDVITDENGDLIDVID